MGIDLKDAMFEQIEIDLFKHSPDLQEVGVIHSDVWYVYKDCLPNHLPNRLEGLIERMVG